MNSAVTCLWIHATHTLPFSLYCLPHVKSLSANVKFCASLTKQSLVEKRSFKHWPWAVLWTELYSPMSPPHKDEHHGRTAVCPPLQLLFCVFISQNWMQVHTFSQFIIFSFLVNGTQWTQGYWALFYFNIVDRVVFVWQAYSYNVYDLSECRMAWCWERTQGPRPVKWWPTRCVQRYITLLQIYSKYVVYIRSVATYLFEMLIQSVWISNQVA